MVGTIIDRLGGVIWVIEIQEVVTMVDAVAFEEVLGDVILQVHVEEMDSVVEEGEEAEDQAGAAITEDEDRVEVVISEEVLGEEILIIEIHVEEMLDSVVEEVAVAVVEVDRIRPLIIGVILVQKCLISMVR